MSLRSPRWAMGGWLRVDENIVDRLFWDWMKWHSVPTEHLWWESGWEAGGSDGIDIRGSFGPASGSWDVEEPPGRSKACGCNGGSVCAAWNKFSCIYGRGSEICGDCSPSWRYVSEIKLKPASWRLSERVVQCDTSRQRSSSATYTTEVRHSIPWSGF